MMRPNYAVHSVAATTRLRFPRPLHELGAGERER